MIKKGNNYVFKLMESFYSFSVDFLFLVMKRLFLSKHLWIKCGLKILIVLVYK